MTCYQVYFNLPALSIPLTASTSSSSGNLTTTAIAVHPLRINVLAPSNSVSRSFILPQDAPEGATSIDTQTGREVKTTEPIFTPVRH